MDLADFLGRLPAELQPLILSRLSAREYAALRACSRRMRAAADGLGSHGFRALATPLELAKAWHRRVRCGALRPPTRYYYPGSIISDRLRGGLAARAMAALKLRRAPACYRFSFDRQDTADLECRFRPEGQPLGMCVYWLAASGSIGAELKSLVGAPAAELAEFLQAEHSRSGFRRWPTWRAWFSSHWDEQARAFLYGFTWRHVAAAAVYAQWIRANRFAFRKVHLSCDWYGDCSNCHLYGSTLANIQNAFPLIDTLSITMGYADKDRIAVPWSIHKFELFAVAVDAPLWTTAYPQNTGIGISIAGLTRFIGIAAYSNSNMRPRIVFNPGAPHFATRPETTYLVEGAVTRAAYCYGWIWS